MKILTIAAAAAVAMTGIAGSAYAQEVEAEKRENATTYRIVLTSVKPGQGDAWEARWEKVKEIEKAAGLPTAKVHHMMTGDHGLMIMIPMPEGMAALDWDKSPSSAAFDNAAIGMMGADGFAEWQKGWMEVLEEPKTYYSHVHH